jgi:hypothetical protein
MESSSCQNLGVSNFGIFIEPLIGSTNAAMCGVLTLFSRELDTALYFLFGEIVADPDTTDRLLWSSMPCPSLKVSVKQPQAPGFPATRNSGVI